MNKTSFFSLWSGMFILCAGLGFIPEPGPVLSVFLILLAIGFFVPPFFLLRNAEREGDRNTAALVRNLSALSLGLPVALLVLNFLSLMWPEALGTTLYAVLVIVSAPMVCGQYWVLCLFLWACLLIMSLQMLKKMKKRRK